MSKLKALYVLDANLRERIYGPLEDAALRERLEFINEPQTAQTVTENPSLLQDVECIVSGWGCVKFEQPIMDAAQNLKLVLYGAGSIKYLVTDAFWARNIPICSAWAANAVPVAEYTLSQILFCLKHGYRFAREVREARAFVQKGSVPGAFESTVGLVSLGMIGRMMAEHLKRFDMKVIAYDPFVKPDAAAELGVELCSLEEVFTRSDVVSLHTPWLKETENMIKGAHFESMKDGASFINTSRGAVVNEPEMVEVLTKRPDLQAVLDVTFPEPPPSESPLYDLPNVVLTPHIAGSMAEECRRMGQYMIAELDRFYAGEPLQWSVSEKQAAVMA